MNYKYRGSYSMSSSSSSGGVGFVGILQIVFIVLKLCKLISWSWWAVLIPTFISIGLLVILLAIVVLAHWLGR